MPFDLVRKESIAELCGHRDSALKLFGDAYDALLEAQRAVGRASPSGNFRVPEEYRGSPFYRLPDRETWDKQMRVAIDRSVWSHLMSVGQFETLMDYTAREQFRKELWGDEPPAATVENCWATFSQLMEDSGTIFRRGIAVAFSKLDRRFRSHDGFKIGTRIVLTYFCNDGRINYGAGAEERLRDVERAFRTLDGVPHPERMEGIIGKANAAMTWTVKTCDVEDDYFRLRCFKNGNAHLWFKRADLVEKVNKLLAQHYGAVLGDGMPGKKEHENRPGHARNMGYFPTPADVAESVAEKAQLYRKAGDAPLRILEPSAGTGALIAAALSKTRDVAPHVTACEIDSARARALAASGIVNRMVSDDFLDVSPDLLGQFDRILMNPPFDGGRDIDHVRHALKFLAPGGRLVAIMSAGTEFREDARTVAFRELAATMQPRYSNEQWTDLPPGSFKESGTMVNAVILVLQSQVTR